MDIGPQAHASIKQGNEDAVANFPRRSCRPATLRIANTSLTNRQARSARTQLLHLALGISTRVMVQTYLPSSLPASRVTLDAAPRYCARIPSLAYQGNERVL